MEDDVVEQRHERSPDLLRSRSTVEVSRNAGMRSLATDWSWLAMVLAVLPGLTNLKRINASGGMERVARVWWVAIRPSVGAPPTACCVRSVP